MKPIDPDFTEYVIGNSAHECGHMAVLFKAGRLAGLNYLPHEYSEDGRQGVVETDVGDELRKEDCVALAAGTVGESLYLGSSKPERAFNDRKQIERLAGEPLEKFASEAHDIIGQNRRFFNLLNEEVPQRMAEVIVRVRALPKEAFVKLPDKVSIITLAEVEAIYLKAEKISS
jgi:hypothetical protein